MNIVLPIQENGRMTNDVFRFFCAHKAALTVLDYYGITDGIYYLNNSPDLRCEMDERESGKFIASIDYIPILTTLRRKTDFIYGDDYRHIWKHNKEQIIRGRPVIIGVDQYYLPYHAEYRASHGAHTVVLYGFDDAKKQAFILDEGYFNGTIDYKQIHQARISENSWNFNINTGAALRYASLTLDDTGWPDISQALVYRHLEESTAYFEPSEKKMVGYPGLKWLMHQFLMNTSIKEKKPIYFRYIHSQLLPQAQKKRLFHFFLLHVRNRNEILQLINQIEYTNQTWSMLLLTVLKLAYTLRNKSALIHEIQEMVEQIFQQEEKIYTILKTFRLLSER